MKLRWISLFGLVLAACESPPTTTLTVSVLPDRSPEALRRLYTPLIDHLEAETGLALNFVLAEDYAGLLEAFVEREVDLALFGGMTFAEAERRARAEPLVMRDTDVAFRSCYIVPADEQRRTIEEFENARFAFGSKLSTSGHVMPRYFMGAKSIEPESFFSSVRHAPDHEQSIYLVRDGSVDMAVVNCIIYETLLASGSVSGLRVLETSPPYADYVWAVQADLDPRTRILLREAFLALDATVDEELVLLRSLGANAYLPAGRSDFDDVRRAASANAADRTGT